MLLDRLRDSFEPECERSEALLHQICDYIEDIHLVEGRAEYKFALYDLGQYPHGIHEQGFEILVNTKTQFQLLAGIHEMGHALDAVFINSAEYSVSPLHAPLFFASDMAQGIGGSPGYGPLLDWFQAVQASNLYANLNNALNQKSISPRMQSEIEALLKVRELWARSYEQYICRRYLNTVIAKSMAHEIKQQAVVGTTIVNNYWQGSDFDGVELEIEAMFRRLGWLVK